MNEKTKRMEIDQQDSVVIAKHKVDQICESSTTTNEGSTILPSHYSPGEYDVICARGNNAKTHTGNLFFQSIIEETAPRYSASQGKLSKSIIVSAIIDTIRRLSPKGGFVKPSSGQQWIEIGNRNAREKVSQAFRDQLHSQYRSSTKSKRQKKDEVNSEMHDSLDAFVKSNQFVLSHMAMLTSTIENHKYALSDAQLEQLMSRVNSDILNELRGSNIVHRASDHQG